MRKKITNLQRTYRRLNRKWFDNELPKDLDITWMHLDGDRLAQCCYNGNGKAMFIEISEDIKYWPRTILWALLHEMCHLLPPCINTHGAEFDKRMLSLAKRGAFHDVW